MMPYMAQGAAQALEDAACLRSALAAYGDESIAKALIVYEKQRAPRAEYIVKNTRVLQEWLHLYDGPARDKRDELMRQDDERNPIFWWYSVRKEWLFGLDAGRLLEDGEDLHIPKLPSLPPLDASIYRQRTGT
jgi:salicylate hydroxylase